MTAPMTTPNDVQDFSAEDVQQILTMAMTRNTSSRAQLDEMASELSIDSSTLAYAVDAWHQKKAQLRQKQQRRQQFYRYELLPYIAVNAFLIALNISIAGTITWAMYPLLGWGLGVLTGATSFRCGSGSKARAIASGVTE